MPVSASHALGSRDGGTIVEKQAQRRVIVSERYPVLFRIGADSVDGSPAIVEVAMKFPETGSYDVDAVLPIDIDRRVVTDV